MRRSDCVTGQTYFAKTGGWIPWNQPHPLGDPRKGQRRECASAFRRHRQDCTRSQRRNRKLSGPQRTTDPKWRCKFSIRHRYRSSSASDRKHLSPARRQRFKRTTRQRDARGIKAGNWHIRHRRGARRHPKFHCRRTPRESARPRRRQR